MPLAKDVVAIEHDFIDLLQHIPGTKEEKQGYFRSRGIQVPRTNYDFMWDALAIRLHRSGAASVVFELLRTKMPSRVSALLRTAKKGNPVNLHVSDPAVVHDLFFQNGNLRRIGQLFIEDLSDRASRLARPPSRPAGARRHPSHMT